VEARKSEQKQPNIDGEFICGERHAQKRIKKIVSIWAQAKKLFSS
jgi:hypothetical protein